ncbi:MAG: putative metal-dependent hydrolase [Planctomycetota bacterium]
MDDQALEPLRFPIGRFHAPPAPPSEAELAAAQAELLAFPAAMRRAVEGLTDAQLDTAYRPGGWTVRQVVHHCADSHANSLIRFKWALTEDEPTIKAYFEERWAELPDYHLPVAVSLDHLDALHARWVALLRSLSPGDLQRGFIHPESGQRITLDVNTLIYAWHGRHHLAHVTELARRSGW